MFYFNEGIILKAVTLILTQASSLQFWLTDSTNVKLYCAESCF